MASATILMLCVAERQIHGAALRDLMLRHDGFRFLRDGLSHGVHWNLLEASAAPRSASPANPRSDLEAHLNAANLVVILSHPESTGNEFLTEMYRRACERHARGETRLILVHFAPPLFSVGAMEGISVLPRNGQPVSEWPSFDGALEDVVAGIRAIVAALPARRPIRIFYSYSHKDEGLRNELTNHLSALRRGGLIHEWHDRQILPGETWDQSISFHLERAQLILLLFSADFLASNYCYDVEARRALQRHEAGEARAIPVILRPVLWKQTPFGALQALPTDARPVTEWPNPDLAFVNICEGILAVILAWRAIVPESPQSRPAQRRRTRVLDAALPTTVAIGKATVLAVVIRRPSSPGLARIVELDASYGLTPEDAHSTGPYRVEFSADQSGKLTETLLQIHVESPDFEPPHQTKEIRVPPEGDALPRIFLMTPRRYGMLIVNVELSSSAGLLTSLTLRTSAVADAKAVGTQRVASVELISADTAGGPDRNLWQLVMPAAGVTIPLTQTGPFWTADITDKTLLRNSRFFLAVEGNLDMGDLIRRVHQLVKVGSKDTVDHLYRFALPGLALNHTPAPPAAIPFRPSFQYFGIDQSGRIWNDIVVSGSIAVYLPPEMLQTRVQLFAVRPWEDMSHEQEEPVRQFVWKRLSPAGRLLADHLGERLGGNPQPDRGRFRVWNTLLYLILVPSHSATLRELQEVLRVASWATAMRVARILVEELSESSPRSLALWAGTKAREVRLSEGVLLHTEDDQ